MRAVVIRDQELVLEDRETPAPVADEVLVRVAGAGVNRADPLQQRGYYPAPAGWPTDVPGLEFSGTVERTGPHVRALTDGDRVFGIVGGGAHATHLLTREDLCAHLPDGLDQVEAGGIPEVFVTAYDAMVMQGGLRPGHRVLIHGVGSGVGTAATQIARSVGAISVGTSRTKEKLERAREYGLDEGVLAGEGMQAHIGEVDLVIDLIGGEYLASDVGVCKPQGRIIIVGLLAGGRAQLDLGAVLKKRLTITGTVLRARPHHQKAAAMASFAAEVVPLFERGLLRPVIDEVVPLADAHKAYELLESNRTFGKIVLNAQG
jgi:NADPH2:quinone reductase